MKNFKSPIPSKNQENVNLTKKTFDGGMTTIPTAGTSMIIIDLRNLKLSVEDGKALEMETRNFVLQKLFENNQTKSLLEDLNIAELESSVFGVSFV